VVPAPLPLRIVPCTRLTGRVCGEVQEQLGVGDPHLGRHEQKQIRVERCFTHFGVGHPSEVNLLRAEVRVRRLERRQADCLAAPPAPAARIG
jgi:hypothetical protein